MPASNFQGGIATDVYGGIQQIPVVVSVDSALAIPAASAIYHITKGSIAALTLAAPTAGTDDGKRITVITETAFAHVLTQGTVGFNGKGSSGTATWTNAKGNGVTFVARNGNWWVESLNGVTIA